MAASETLRFDIVGDDSRASAAFSRAGRSASEMSAKMDAAAFKAAALDDALKRQRETARRTADATLSLAKSDEILAEVERRLADGALEAEFALKKEAEAKRKSAEEARRASAENAGFAASLRKIADSMQKGGGPAWLGPALLAIGPASSLLGVTAGAAIGLAGAFTAAAGALAAFGAVAKPVLSQALTAEQAVQSAQDAYTLAVQNTTGQYRIAMSVAKTQAQRTAAYAAEQKGFAADRLAEAQAINKAYIEMSPQQIALSRQLGAMANAWHNLKAAETPVVAGALQPWLKDVTDLAGKLGPIIGKVSSPVHDLGVQFGILVNSSVFSAFAGWVGTTGSAVARSAGNAVLDLITGITFILPRFTPLIRGAADGISRWGDAFARWSASQKAADEIQRFLKWFHSEGPAVGGLLKNIGGALKALTPGLGPASVSELNMISGFFGLIAKLPPGLARPLTEVATALLTLNKLGVVKVGLKIFGFGGGAAAAEGEAAAGAAAGGLWSRLLPGVRFAAGALIATVAIRFIGSQVPQSHDPQVRADQKKTPGIFLKADDFLHLTGMAGWIDKYFSHPVRAWAENSLPHFFTAGWDKVSRETAVIFGGIRRDTARIWDTIWQNTVGRADRGVHDVASRFDTLRHGIATRFDGMRHDVASVWDTVWSNTIGAAIRGVGGVLRWVGTIPGKIMTLFSNAGSWLVSAGQALVSGLVSGIESAGGAVVSALSGLIPGPLRGPLHHVLGWLGFADGTMSAPPGWHWVGERGPELMRFRGGEQVLSAPVSAAVSAPRLHAMAWGGAAPGGAAYAAAPQMVVVVRVDPAVAAVTPDRQLGRHIAGHLTQYIQGNGRLYPPGIAPR